MWIIFSAERAAMIILGVTSNLDPSDSYVTQTQRGSTKDETCHWGPLTEFAIVKSVALRGGGEKDSFSSEVAM